MRQPRRRGRPPKDVSLGAEMAALARAVDSVRLLLDAEALDEPAPANRRLAAEAVGSLVFARLVQLRLAVVGGLDPGLLHAEHNTVIASPGGDPDIVLRARRA